MNRSIVVLIVLVVGAGLSRPASAQSQFDSFWRNPLGSNWHSAANWEDFFGGPGAVPDQNNRAIFGFGGGVTPSTPVFLTNDAQARGVWGTAQINLRGHEFAFGPSDPSIAGVIAFFSGDGAAGSVIGGDLEVEGPGLTIGRNTAATFTSLRGPIDFNSGLQSLGFLTVRDGAEVLVSEPLETFFMSSTVTGPGSRLRVAGSLPAGGPEPFPTYDWFVRDEGYMQIDGNVTESFSFPSHGVLLENGVLEINSSLGSRSLGGYGVVVAPSSTTFTGPGMEIVNPIEQVNLTGTLEVKPTQAATFFSLGPARLGVDTNVNGGALRSASGFLLENNRWITTLGTSTIEGPLTMAGGVLDASANTTLVSPVHGFGTVVGAAVSTHPSNTINSPGGTVALDRALDVGSRTAVIYSAGPAQLGSATSLDGGTLRVQSGMSGGQPVIGSLLLGTGATLAGHGDVIGDFFGSEFSTIEATSLGASLAFGGSDSANWRGFITDGDIVVTGQLRLGTTAPAALGRLTQLTGGTIIAANGVVLRDGSTLAGFGTVNSVVAGTTGSIIRADSGDLLLGSPTDPSGFATDGQLQVGGHQVTLRDSNQAVLGSLTTLGDTGPSGTMPGTLVADNGLALGFGGNVTGFGTVDTPDDAAKPFISNGHVIGVSAAKPLTLAGYVKGVGSFDNVVFTGTFSPGFSPAKVNLGSAVYDGTLHIELGGTTPGSGHDQLNHILGDGIANLGGTLEVSLLSGFMPEAGQSFEIITAIGGITGTFIDTILPTLAGNLAWNIDYGANSVTLAVAAPGLPGDFNGDGKVDAADYVLLRKHGGPLEQYNYDQWRANFGITESTGQSGVSTAVPEPAAWMLALGGLTACFATRRRRQVLPSR